MKSLKKERKQKRKSTCPGAALNGNLGCVTGVKKVFKILESFPISPMQIAGIWRKCQKKKKKKERKRRKGKKPMTGIWLSSESTIDLNWKLSLICFATPTILIYKDENK